MDTTSVLYRGTPADRILHDLIRRLSGLGSDYLLMAEPWWAPDGPDGGAIRFQVASDGGLFRRVSQCGQVFPRDEGGWDAIGLMMGPAKVFPTRDEAMDCVDAWLRGQGWMLP